MGKGTYENPRLKSVRSVFGARPSPFFRAEAEKRTVLNLSMNHIECTADRNHKTSAIYRMLCRKRVAQ